jgi:NTP pyrophosphatase (non-canonical NTP hydrolase)
MQLSNSEAELLTILMEECGEVTQASSKCIRFGLTEDNVERLVGECGDLMAMVGLLWHYGIVGEDELERAAARKLEKLKRFSDLDIPDP